MIWVDSCLKIAYHLSYAPELHLLFSILKETYHLTQDLKISSKSGKTDSQHNFGIRILIMSCPWALFGSKFFIILAISALVTEIDESVLVVFMLSLA